MGKHYFKIEHVDRLIQGKSSGARIGSRQVGHHLTQHEKSRYQRAMRDGYLTVNAKHRSNLWDVWHKACQARNMNCLIMLKLVDDGAAQVTAIVYCNNERVFSGNTTDARLVVLQLLENKQKSLNRGENE